MPGWEQPAKGPGVVDTCHLLDRVGGCDSGSRMPFPSLNFSICQGARSDLCPLVNTEEEAPGMQAQKVTVGGGGQLLGKIKK